MTKEELEKSLEFVSNERIKLQNENELLKEELCTLKNDIIQLYHIMMGLESINKHELEDIEEI